MGIIIVVKEAVSGYPSALCVAPGLPFNVTLLNGPFCRYGGHFDCTQRILNPEELNWVHYLINCLFCRKTWFKNRHFSDANGDKPDTRFLLLVNGLLVYTIFHT